MLNQEKQTEIMKEIIETTAKMGISLSDGAMKELEKSCIRVYEFTRKIEEKVASGMSEDEATEWYFNQMSDEEKSKFMADLELVGKYETAKRLLDLDKKD